MMRETETLADARGGARYLPYAIAAGVGLGLFLLIALGARWLGSRLGDPSLLTGYALLLLILFLGAFNTRKRLSVLPLSAVRWWTTAHVTGGLVALGIFWVHTGSVWPNGLYEQMLALFFYAVSATGIAGYVLEQALPHRLTQSSVEVIFERIPDELARLRKAAEAEVLRCTEDNASDTLARLYLERFAWYFRRPRFLLSHLFGSHRAAYWLERQVAAARRYLNAGERAHLARIEGLARAKMQLDLHYAAQATLKLWLLFHVPGAVGLVALALWHLLLVNVYAI